MAENKHICRFEEHAVLIIPTKKRKVSDQAKNGSVRIPTVKLKIPGNFFFHIFFMVADLLSTKLVLPTAATGR